MTKILDSFRQRNNLDKMNLENATDNEDWVQEDVFPYSLYL